MEQLNVILFGVGFAIIISAFIITLIKVIKKSKMGFVVPILIIIGLASAVTGVWMTLQTNNPISKLANSSGNNNSASSSTNNTVKEDKFDPNGSLEPKTVVNSSYAKTITDADGRKTIVSSNGETPINYDQSGIRFYKTSNEEVVVQVPENKATAEGKWYKNYDYSKDNLNGYIYISEGDKVVPDETTVGAKDVQGGQYKSEEYNQGSTNDMSQIDFVYKMLPDVSPKSTVANNFLSGVYVGKEEKIMSTNTTMTINILDDKLLEFKCSYIAGMDSTYGYKLEPLGKNAYKLYLYTATIKADSNGGGTTISDKPLKRTFLIYRKSKDSFDIVFVDDNINRMSVSMNKA